MDWKTKASLVARLLETTFADEETQWRVQTFVRNFWFAADTDEPDDALLIAQPLSTIRELAHECLRSGGVRRGSMGTMRHAVELLNQYFEARQRGEQADELLSACLLAARVDLTITDEAREASPGHWVPITPAPPLVTGIAAVTKSIAGYHRASDAEVREHLFQLGATVLMNLLATLWQDDLFDVPETEQAEYKRKLSSIGREVVRYTTHFILGFIAIGDSLAANAPPTLAPALLGRDTASDEPVTLTAQEQSQGLYILGKNGMGKTTLLEHLIMRDIAAGLGVVVLDPHGDLTERLLARIPTQRLRDVVLLDAADEEYAFGLNLFECDDPQNSLRLSETVGRVMDVFEKAFGSGIRLEQYLPNCAKLLMAGNLTLAELPELFASSALRQQLLAKLSPRDRAHRFWAEFDELARRDWNEAERRRDSTVGRATVFLDNAYVQHIVGQHTTVNWRELLDAQRIVLVKLAAGAIEDRNVGLIGSLIVSQIRSAALSRQDVPEEERPVVMLYADEYHRFATPDFARFFDELRKYRVWTTIAHQRRGQLQDEGIREAALGAVNFIGFQMERADAEDVLGYFDRTNLPVDVVGEKPIKVIPPEPFTVILSQGHHNTVVNQAAQQLRDLLLQLDEYVWSTAKFRLDQATDMQPGRRRVEAAINAYHGMTYQTGNWETVVRRARAEWPEAQLAEFDRLFVHGLEERVATYGEQVRHQAEVNLSYDGVHPGTAVWAYAETYEAVPRHVRLTGNFGALQARISSTVAWLHRMLRSDPIRVNSGSFEPDLRPISTAEYEHRIVARLSGLPRFTACGAFEREGGHAEHTFRVEPAPALAKGYEVEHKRAEIRARSRAEYYRPRAAVEEDIAGRLAQLNAAVREPRQTMSRRTKL